MQLLTSSSKNFLPVLKINVMASFCELIYGMTIGLIDVDTCLII